MCYTDKTLTRKNTNHKVNRMIKIYKNQNFTAVKDSSNHIIGYMRSTIGMRMFWRTVQSAIIQIIIVRRWSNDISTYIV